MTYNTHENNSGKHDEPATCAVTDVETSERLATFIDYLMEPAFMEFLDAVVSVHSEYMPFHHDEFAEFAEEHLAKGNWEEQRFYLMQLADQMVNDGKDLRRIIDEAPEHAVTLRLAKAHAAAIAGAKTAKEASIYAIQKEIEDFWEAEEESDDDGRSNYGISGVYQSKDRVVSVEHEGVTKSAFIGDASAEALAMRLLLEIRSS